MEGTAIVGVLFEETAFEGVPSDETASVGVAWEGVAFGENALEGVAFGKDALEVAAWKGVAFEENALEGVALGSAAFEGNALKAAAFEEAAFGVNASEVPACGLQEASAWSAEKVVAVGGRMGVHWWAAQSPSLEVVLEENAKQVVLPSYLVGILGQIPHVGLHAGCHVAAAPL